MGQDFVAKSAFCCNRLYCEIILLEKVDRDMTGFKEIQCSERDLLKQRVYFTSGCDLIRDVGQRHNNSGPSPFFMQGARILDGDRCLVGKCLHEGAMLLCKITDLVAIKI